MRFISLYLLITLSGSLTWARECAEEDDKALDTWQKGLLIAVQELPKEKAKAQEYVLTTEHNGFTMPVKVNRYAATTQPTKGSVLYFCGGPSACMHYRPKNVPKHYDVVVSDYIGLGKNANAPAPRSMMSIRAQAVAASKIVAALKIKNYVIYGQSFGTTVATMATEELQKLNLPQPKSVILEGVVGSAETMNLDGYKRTADRAWQMMSHMKQETFKQSYRRATKHMTRNQKLDFDQGLMSHVWKGPAAVATALNALSMKEPKESVTMMAASAPSFIEDTQSSDQFLRMYLSAGCDISHKMKPPGQRTLLFGGLVENPYESGLEFCKCRTEKTSYDSKKHQIRAPIVYINGDMDAPTPIESARYHWRNQTQTASKVFIELKDEGHFPTSSTLANCTDEIYDKAFAGDIATLGVRDFNQGCKPSSTKILLEPSTYQ